MGFFDSLGEYIGGEMKKANDRFNKASENASRLDDKELMRRARDSGYTNSEKLAYLKELRNRGYGGNGGEDD